MAGFRFDSQDSRPSPVEPAKAIDALVSASGGAPLPGVFGLAQVLAETWTTKADGPRWLRFSRSALMSAGAILAYHKSKQPPETQSSRDRVQEWLDANHLVAPSELREIASLAYVYLKMTSTFKDEKVAGEDTVLRRFSCGIVALFYSKAGLQATEKDGYAPAGIFCVEGQEAAALSAVREAIWTGVGGDLDFSSTEGQWGEPIFSLSRLADPSDYVDRKENGEHAVLGQLADRCQRFTAAGLRRGLLFWGSPGTGKSSLARQLATAVGNGRALRLDPEAVTRASSRRLIEMVTLLQPSVVLLDDLDRANGVDGLLSMIEDGAGASVVIATVNAVDRLDPALLRPGRFDEVIEVPAPSAAWLRDIAAHYVERFGAVVDLDALMPTVEGFTPAELRELLQVVAIVGADILPVEVERLSRQRALYSGDAVSCFLRDRK